MSIIHTIFNTRYKDAVSIDLFHIVKIKSRPFKTSSIYYTEDQTNLKINHKKNENNELPATEDRDIKKKKRKKSKKEKNVETPPVAEDSGCENEDAKYKKAKKIKKEKTKEKKKYSVSHFRLRK